MDPITSLGIATNAIQLADFILRLVCGVRSIYKSASGLSDGNLTIESNTLELHKLVAKSGLKGISDTARLCSEIADELLSALEKLRRGEKTVWASFRAALKAVLGKTKVEELRSRIFQVHGLLVVEIQVAIMDNQSSLGKFIHRIDERSRVWEMQAGKTLEQIRDELRGKIRESEQQVQETLAPGARENPQAPENVSSAARERRSAHGAQCLCETPATGESYNVTTVQKALNRCQNMSDDESSQDMFLAIARHIDQLTFTLSDLLTKTKTLNDGQSILETIGFMGMRARHSDIREAHSQTFTWIFCDTPEEQATMHFCRWLSEGEGVFWIRGKAGSGKSTLMKFLVQHHVVTWLLSKWAGQTALFVASYFFWSTGSHLQKCLEGLFRTLIFDMLCASPEKIAEVGEKIPIGPDHKWSATDLQLAIECLGEGCLSKKFCFFIDGLDEFEGNPDELIDILQGLTAVPNVKVCVSSRPWTPFVEAFGQEKTKLLRLEELTTRDIRRFAQDSLVKNKQYRAHMADKFSVQLIDEIVRRAQGVFLWVDLVIKSLLVGLTHADRRCDLWRRLQSLPPDLETFFRHIISSIDPFYRRQSVETLLVAVNAAEPLPLSIYYILDDLDEHPTMTADYAQLYKVDDDAQVWEDQITRRLDARTKGLLEVRSTTHEGEVWGDYFRYRVEFLHRTVKDFIVSNEIRILFSQQPAPSFDPLERLSSAFVALIRSEHLSIHDEKLIHYLLEHVFHYAWRMETERMTTPKLALDALERIMKKFPRGSMPKPTRWAEHYIKLRKWPFLTFAVARGLKIYVAKRLQEIDQGVEGDDRKGRLALLAAALVPSIPRYRARRIFADMVQLVLGCGMSPNEYATKTALKSIWNDFIETFHGCKDPLLWSEELGCDYCGAKEVVGALISAGASLTDGFVRRDSESKHHFITARDTIREKFTSADADYLLSLSPVAGSTAAIFPYEAIHSTSTTTALSTTQSNNP